LIETPVLSLPMNQPAAAAASTSTDIGTKRKLEQALDLLDSALVTPTTVLPPKRPRRSLYASLSSMSVDKSSASNSVVTPTLSAILARRSKKPVSPSSFNPGSISSETLSYGYRPSSTPSFLSRLLTYKLSTYSNKPTPINAVAASRAGWINEGKDRLLCCICHASFVLADRVGLGRVASDMLIEKQKQGLVFNHKEGCPWRERQCDR
jgi:hypothetical protein